VKWNIEEKFEIHRLHYNTNYNRIVNAEAWKSAQLKNLGHFDTQWPMKFEKPHIKELLYDTISQLKFNSPSQFKIETLSEKGQDLEKIFNYIKDIVTYETATFKFLVKKPTLTINSASLWIAIGRLADLVKHELKPHDVIFEPATRNGGAAGPPGRHCVERRA
jgi:hypothetical protein